MDKNELEKKEKKAFGNGNFEVVGGIFNEDEMLKRLNNKDNQVKKVLENEKNEVTHEVFIPSKTNKVEKGNENLKVFLCHSSGDKPTVEKFYNTLIKNGVKPWLDKFDLIPGQEWRIEIPKAVKNSHVVIVFLSHNSINKEGYVQKEISIALDIAEEKPAGTIFIIPAKLESCEIPERLSKYHWVNLYESDGYERIIKALQIRAKSLDINI